MRVVVGRVVRPHGVRGEAVVEPRTDRPEQRFCAGQAMLTDRGTTLRVRSSRRHGERLLVQFDGVADRDAVEALRGLRLQVEVEPAIEPSQPDVYDDMSLIGLTALLVSGEVVGRVHAVEHLPMHDLLVVEGDGGRRARVPFVKAIVVDVNLPDKRLTIDPPAGLLDLEAP